MATLGPDPHPLALPEVDARARLEETEGQHGERDQQSGGVPPLEETASPAPPGAGAGTGVRNASCAEPAGCDTRRGGSDTLRVDIVGAAATIEGKGAARRSRSVGTQQGG